MIAAIRAAILKPQDCSSHLKTVFFHSTHILQRKHQSNSETRNKKLSGSGAKQDLRRNEDAFSEHLFGIWSDGFDYSDKHPSWFGKQYYRVCKRNRIGRHIPERLNKRRSINLPWLRSIEEEEDDQHSSTEFSDSGSNQESHRQALGLSSSGPLNLEDVKKAYRVCALKWHPDRHNDSTKIAAEKKYKLCTVAYQSLCEKFAMN